MLFHNEILCLVFTIFFETEVFFFLASVFDKAGTGWAFRFRALVAGPQLAMLAGPLLGPGSMPVPIFSGI
jgi:hypothetical protein